MSAVYTKTDAKRKGKRTRDGGGAGIRGDWMKSIQKDAMAEATAATDALAAAEGRGKLISLQHRCVQRNGTRGCTFE
jgi:hypothetical protein